MLASAAKMETGDDCDDSVIYSFQKIKCVIILSGLPSMHNGPLLTSNIDIAEQDSKLDIKSLHIFGEKDTSVPKSCGDKLANCFVSPETYYHGKEHVIPHNAAFCERVIQFVDSCLVDNRFGLSLPASGHSGVYNRCTNLTNSIFSSRVLLESSFTNN